MLRIERAKKKLAPLRVAGIGSLSERYELSELIFNSADEFFGEVRQKLFVVARKLQPSKAIQVEVDLLALDREGQAVIVSTQQGGEHPYLAGAITCAGIISQWAPQDFLDRLEQGRLAALRSFLQVPVNEINHRQRWILIAEDFNYEELTAAKWLRERHGLDVLCVRVVMATDPQGYEYLSVTDLSEWSLPIYRMLKLKNREEEKIEQRTGGRRRQPRSAKYRCDCLKVKTGDHELQAHLVDISDGGLGIEMTAPLPVGSDVILSGDLYGEDSNVAIEGRARVAHCLSVDESVFRIGLNFKEVKYKRLEPESLSAAGENGDASSSAAGSWP